MGRNYQPVGTSGLDLHFSGFCMAQMTVFYLNSVSSRDPKRFATFHGDERAIVGRSTIFSKKNRSIGRSALPYSTFLIAERAPEKKKNGVN